MHAIALPPPPPPERNEKERDSYMHVNQDNIRVKYYDIMSNNQTKIEKSYEKPTPLAAETSPRSQYPEFGLGEQED